MNRLVEMIRPNDFGKKEGHKLLYDNILIRNYKSLLSNTADGDLSADRLEMFFENLMDDLVFYSTYGKYDIIIPFLESVHIFCNEQLTKSIDSIIQSFPDGSFIQKTLENYHKAMCVEYERVRGIGNISEEEAWEYALNDTPANIEKGVWESYDVQSLPNIEDSIKRNFGLWTPALYTKNIPRTILGKISHEFIMALEGTIQACKSNPRDERLRGLVEQQLRMTLGELRLRYCVCLNAEAAFFRMDIKDIRRLSGRELKEDLFYQITKSRTDGSYEKEQDPYFDYDEEWVKAIEKICKIYIGEYGDDQSIQTGALLLHIPLLYQLINQYETAEEKLITQLNANRGLFYSVGPLISCTIILAKTKKDRCRDWICSYLENAYSLFLKNETIRQYLSLLDDTIQFFEIYFREVKEYVNSLDTETRNINLQIMNIHAQRSDCLLDEDSNLWIYCNLVQDGSFIKAIQGFKAMIENADNPLIDAEDSLRNSLDLFYSMSSHLGQNPRIHVEEVLGVLGKKSENDDIEVFYNESIHDEYWHEVLDGRYKRLQSELPSRKYTMRVMEIIQEFCEGDSFIMSKIISACAKISDNPVNYSSYKEDEYNTEIRNLLRASLGAKGYEICDQTLQGTGKTGERQGELDIQIRKNDLPIAIYEGLLGKGNEWRKTHIEKTIRRYNISGCKRIYLVEFYQKGVFVNYWKEAKESLKSYSINNIQEIDSRLMGIRVCEGTFNWNSNGEGVFVYICVNCVPC